VSDDLTIGVPEAEMSDKMVTYISMTHMSFFSLSCDGQSIENEMTKPLRRLKNENFVD
jgi:hypothetical protein